MRLRPQTGKADLRKATCPGLVTEVALQLEDGGSPGVATSQHAARRPLRSRSKGPPHAGPRPEVLLPRASPPLGLRGMESTGSEVTFLCSQSAKVRSLLLHHRKQITKKCHRS